MPGDYNIQKKIFRKEVVEKNKNRSKARCAFYSHLASYFVINIALVVIWSVTGTRFPWFIFPGGIWSIGILFHFARVFIFLDGTNLDTSDRVKEVD